MFKLAILLVAVSLPFIQSFTYSGPLTDDYCQGTGVGDLQIGKGKRDEVKCVECRCYSWGYSCSGVGYNAGTMQIPGCTQVKLDGCCYKFIDANNDECVAERCPSPFEQS